MNTTLYPLVLLLFIQLLSPLSFAGESAEQGPEIKVYRSPTCQCCHKWITHLQSNDFNVIDLLSNNMANVKRSVKLPEVMTSCHTAIIDGYIIEGHVPADDIYRLLASKPNIRGLSVPQMPVGTPGMEMAERKDPFIVFQFDQQGRYSIFTKYEVDDNNEYYIVTTPEPQ